jgi:hypothetical protein
VRRSIDRSGSDDLSIVLEGIGFAPEMIGNDHAAYFIRIGHGRMMPGRDPGNDKAGNINFK